MEVGVPETSNRGILALLACMSIVCLCASLLAIYIGFTTGKFADFMYLENWLVNLLYYLTAAVIAVPVFK